MQRTALRAAADAERLARPMSIDECVRKLEGHGAALLDAYRGLRQSFAMLEPILPSGRVSRALSNAAGREGLAALRQALFLGCALDVAKLSLDKNSRTPSLVRLVASLDQAAVVAALRSRSSHYCLPRKPGDDTDEASLRKIEEVEESARGKAFDERLASLREGWAVLSAEPLRPFAVLRDKYIAHLELRCRNGEYAPIDLGDLGLKWSDLGEAIAAMEPLVLGLTAVIRAADFDMPAAVHHFERVRDDFWARAR